MGQTTTMSRLRTRRSGKIFLSPTPAFLAPRLHPGSRLLLDAGRRPVERWLFPQVRGPSRLHSQSRRASRFNANREASSVPAANVSNPSRLAVAPRSTAVLSTVSSTSQAAYTATCVIASGTNIIFRNPRHEGAKLRRRRILERHQLYELHMIEGGSVSTVNGSYPISFNGSWQNVHVSMNTLLLLIPETM